MAQDVIGQLQELCERLREQLMQQPEYRALMSLEKTIEDLSIYMGAPPARMPAPVHFAEPEPEPAFSEPEPTIIDVNVMDETTAMTADSDQLADALVDALRAPKISTARTVDHLPSHRVA